MGRVWVAAGILYAPDSQKVLIAQRPDGLQLAGCWEFPGGKIKPGESPVGALRRELAEEIDIEVTECCLLLEYDHDYEHGGVRLFMHEVRAWRGEVRAREGQALKWVEPGELAVMDMLAGSRPAIDAILGGGKVV
ncbi:MAG: (deoxy)nucleoside triphosphate pyrophosphohydrolase [Gammaproteobacteria bacterium]